MWFHDIQYNIVIYYILLCEYVYSLYMKYLNEIFLLERNLVTIPNSTNSLRTRTDQRTADLSKKM